MQVIRFRGARYTDAASIRFTLKPISERCYTYYYYLNILIEYIVVNTLQFSLEVQTAVCQHLMDRQHDYDKFIDAWYRWAIT